MHKLACPKCHEPLVLEGNSYKCENRHTYDLSKTKYINLLLNPDKATNNPGDSKESLIARKAYLNQGYYNIISDTLIECVKKYTNEKSHILDLGCGEGYYDSKLKAEISLYKRLLFYGSLSRSPSSFFFCLVFFGGSLYLTIKWIRSTNSIGAATAGVTSNGSIRNASLET